MVPQECKSIDTDDASASAPCVIGRVLLLVGILICVLSMLIGCCLTGNIPWVSSYKGVYTLTALLSTHQMLHLATLVLAVSTVLVGFASIGPRGRQKMGDLIFRGDQILR